MSEAIIIITINTFKLSPPTNSSVKTKKNEDTPSKTDQLNNENGYSIQPMVKPYIHDKMLPSSLKIALKMLDTKGTPEAVKAAIYINFIEYLLLI